MNKLKYLINGIVTGFWVTVIVTAGIWGFFYLLGKFGK